MGRRQLPQIEKTFQDSKINYDLYVSQFHEHIIEIAASLDIDSYDGIIGIGGDGTNYQVINGLLAKFLPKQIPPVGILPVGSGNSFARDLGIETLYDGLNAVIGRQIRKVDVCSFSQGQRSHFFVNLTGLGFVTDVADTARKYKIFKDASYLIGVLYRTINLSCHMLEIEIDGNKIVGENCFVECCNSMYTGGGMIMAPEAKIDDGLMDIIIAGRLSRTSLLATLPKIYNGTHVNHPAVQYIQAKKAVIRTVPEKKLLPDGEIVGSTPTTVQVHHKMLRYFV